MTVNDATIVREMIEGIEDAIGTARQQSFSFVARLLEMARLELLMTYHGINEGEIEAFCETLAQEHGAAHNRRSIILGDASARRVRRKPRTSRRSARPATQTRS
jgi:hypothetical protein